MPALVKYCSFMSIFGVLVATDPNCFIVLWKILLPINLQKHFVIDKGLQKQFYDLESGCISMYSFLFSWVALERPLLHSTGCWMNNQRSCDKVLALPRLSPFWYFLWGWKTNSLPNPQALQFIWPFTQHHPSMAEPTKVPTGYSFQGHQGTQVSPPC